jgi:hypothetical protein
MSECAEKEITLIGLEGGNPLAFLAALGTLRSLTLAWPGHRLRMSWRREGPWRPVLHSDRPAGPTQIVQALDQFLQKMRGHPAWSLGPDLNVPAGAFKQYAAAAAQLARLGRDRTWADFVVAFGCESVVNEAGGVQDTALRTMSGAGHQHFLGFMQNIVDRTKAGHLEKSLFQPWRYDDPLDTQTLRWDPLDDVRRALRWRDPSGDPQRRKRGAMLGANRLAIEGLPLLPTVPIGPRLLATTGFSGRGSARMYWTWPIWSGALTLDVVRSLLALRQIQTDPASGEVRRRGVVEVFRSRRLTVGKFRCFTPGEPA